MYQMGMTGRKWDIFQSSVHLFAEETYDKISVRDIAMSVHLQPGSLYTHFCSKEEILKTIYLYYESYARYICMPDVNDLLVRAETEQLSTLLKETLIFWPEEMREILRQIQRILISRMFCDPDALKLLYDTVITPSYDIIRPLLIRLIELGRVAPFDVEAYMVVRLGLCVYSLVCFANNNTLDDNLWANACQLIVDDIVIKNSTDASVRNRDLA